MESGGGATVLGMATSTPVRPQRLTWLWGVAIAVCALGCLAMFSQVDQNWWIERAAGEELITGRAVTNGLAATVPTAILAALALTLVFGPAGKRMIGLVAAGLAAVVAFVAFGARPTEGANVVLGRNSEGVATHTSAFWMFFAGACAAFVGGLLLAWKPGAVRRQAATREAKATDSAWVVLDRGEDPTVG